MSTGGKPQSSTKKPSSRDAGRDADHDEILGADDGAAWLAPGTRKDDRALAGRSGRPGQLEAADTTMPGGAYDWPPAQPDERSPHSNITPQVVGTGPSGKRGSSSSKGGSSGSGKRSRDSGNTDVGLGSLLEPGDAVGGRGGQRLDDSSGEGLASLLVDDDDGANEQDEEEEQEEDTAGGGRSRQQTAEAQELSAAAQKKADQAAEKIRKGAEKVKKAANKAALVASLQGQP